MLTQETLEQLRQMRLSAMASFGPSVCDTPERGHVIGGLLPNPYRNPEFRSES